MGYFNLVVNTIIFVEIAIAGNVVPAQFKQARALSSLITSALGHSKGRLHKIEREVFSQPFVASYRQLSSSSDSEDSEGSVGGPDIVAYLVSSQKEPILRAEPETGQENATDITTILTTAPTSSTTPSISTTSISTPPSSSNFTGISLTLDIPTNSTLRKKGKKKKDKKEKKIKKEKKKKIAGGNTEEIKESLRSCTSKSIKSCRNACKAALKDACETFTCKGKFKGTFKKESKKMCKQMFNEPKRPKERYNSEEDW